MINDIEDYHEWISLYATNPVDPPFDMGPIIDDMQNELFPPAPVEPEVETPTDVAPPEITFVLEMSMDLSFIQVLYKIVLLQTHLLVIHMGSI